jgi:hypothetical protein
VPNKPSKDWLRTPCWQIVGAPIELAQGSAPDDFVHVQCGSQHRDGNAA